MSFGVANTNLSNQKFAFTTQAESTKTPKTNWAWQPKGAEEKTERLAQQLQDLTEENIRLKKITSAQQESIRDYQSLIKEQAALVRENQKLQEKINRQTVLIRDGSSIRKVAFDLAEENRELKWKVALTKTNEGYAKAAMTLAEENKQLKDELNACKAEFIRESVTKRLEYYREKQENIQFHLNQVAELKVQHQTKITEAVREAISRKDETGRRKTF